MLLLFHMTYLVQASHDFAVFMSLLKYLPFLKKKRKQMDCHGSIDHLYHFANSWNNTAKKPIFFLVPLPMKLICYSSAHSPYPIRFYIYSFMSNSLVKAIMGYSSTPPQFVTICHIRRKPFPALFQYPSSYMNHYQISFQWKISHHHL